MQEQTPNPTQCVQEDEIDLRELFNTLKKRKKLIYRVTGAVTLLAVVYAFVATPWWSAEATLEIGKYIETGGKEVYLEDGEAVAQRLKVKYIDIYAHAKDRDVKVEKITSAKKSKQFITISVLGKTTPLAVSEIDKITNELKNKHAKIIEEIIAKKEAQLDGVDRSIYKLNQVKVKKLVDNISYLKKVQLPAVNKKISTVKADLQKFIAQKDEAVQNLSAIQNSDASLAALRLAQIQGLEYKISANEMKLIDLNSTELNITSTQIPDLERQLESIKQTDLAALKEKRKLIKLSMQPHNYHNTQIIGNVVTLDHPVKPKKKLIVIVAFITGLMLSIFLAFFLEFLEGTKEED